MQPGDMRDESFVGEPSQAHEEHLARDSAASQSGGPTNEGHSASPFSQGSQEDIGAAYHQFYPSPPDETSEDPLILSFCACGWLKVYYFGVAKALQESKEFDRAVFVGSSAGSLLAIAMALGLDFDKIKEYQLDCVRRTHGSIRGAFRLQSYVNKIMDEMLPENAVEALQGRVEISITTVRGLRNRRVREFRDRDHLRTAVLASCCMAPLCGIMPMRLDGELMYDGGISDWVRNGLFRGPSGHGISHGRAISINPFWFSRADIRPSQYVPFWWALYPPRVEDFEWVFELGVRGS
ncbi:acyl transferase/acyl hydrolase/lysophospholipase [Baffinella frigidus]|nr:acyl transferase/acyl hydrolase/lysophospholipase [Cryptophyta sp. CCMP2293]